MVDKYKVITLCGSTRFKDEYLETQKRLTLEGNIVISVGLFGHSGDNEVWENMDEGTLTKTKEMLDDMHRRKIDMADEIYVINVGGYIGSSTRSEIEYAQTTGKTVRYLEDTLDVPTEHKGCFIGVDGCRKGWIAAILKDGNLSVGKFKSIEHIIEKHSDFKEFLIDIPIGLPEYEKDHRPDTLARKMLSPRGATVFNVPARQAVYAEDGASQKRENKRILGKSLSNQSLGIISKIREVDEFLDKHQEYKNRLFESHPELCFARLNGMVLLSKKKEKEGIEEREAVLAKCLREERVKELRYKAKEFNCHVDDVLDAVCLSIAAKMKAAGKYEIIPKKPDTDARGIWMQIVIPKR